jgi:hypothetical protein
VRPIFKPATCVSLVTTLRRRLGAPEELSCGPPCAHSGGKDSGSWSSEIAAWLGLSQIAFNRRDSKFLLASFGTAEETRRIIADVQEEGTCLVRWNRVARPDCNADQRLELGNHG